MKALLEVQDLRIGNWIIEPGQDEGKPFQIFSIYHEDKNNKVNGLPIALMQPIPLTEDWLIRFGFEKRFNNDDCNLFDLIGYKEMSLTGLNRGQGFFTLADFTGKNGWYLDLQTRTTLTHVHQLQNLYFAISGEELTIKAEPSREDCINAIKEQVKNAGFTIN